MSRRRAPRREAGAWRQTALACRGAAASEDLVHGGVLHDAAGVHDGHHVGVLGHHAQVVRDEQDRHAVLGLQLRRAVRGSAPGWSRPGPSSARRRSAVAGCSARAMAIMTRCRMPPDSWCGYSLSAALGRCPRRPEPAPRWPPRAPAWATFWCSDDRLDDLVADGVDRIEAGHRLLEDHGDLAAADLAHLVIGQRQDVLAVQRMRPLRIRPGASQAGA